MSSNVRIILPILMIAVCGILPTGDSASQDARATVSLIQLIANAEAHDQEFVRVVGFCSLEFEGNAVYLHQEDYERMLAPNSVWLDTYPPERETHPLHAQYCLVEATFSARPASNGRQGRLALVTRLERLPTREELTHR
jgi:hypothetical protein